MAVHENRLSDATAVGTHSYLPFVSAGSIWVALADTRIIGFAAIDAPTANVWALFVDPAREGQGAGSALHDQMLRWATGEGLERLWLTTTPGTRAERFYRRQGWAIAKTTDSGEIRFEREL